MIQPSAFLVFKRYFDVFMRYSGNGDFFLGFPVTKVPLESSLLAVVAGRKTARSLFVIKRPSTLSFVM